MLCNVFQKILISVQTTDEQKKCSWNFPFRNSVTFHLGIHDWDKTLTSPNSFFFSFICLNFRFLLPEKENYCSSPPCLPIDQAAQPGVVCVSMRQGRAASVPGGSSALAAESSWQGTKIRSKSGPKSREVLQSPERHSLSPNKMFGVPQKWCIFLCELSMPFNEVLQGEVADGRFQFSV